MKIELFGSLMVYLFVILKRKLNERLAISVLAVFNIIWFFFDPFESLGLICFLFSIAIVRFPISISKTGLILVVVVSLYFAGVHQGGKSYYLFEVLFNGKTYTILNLIAALCFCVVFINSGHLQRIFSNKVLAWLGKVSFSLYLIHMSVLFMVDAFLFYIWDIFSYNLKLFPFFSIAISLPISLILASKCTWFDLKSIYLTRVINKNILMFNVSKLEAEK